MLLGLSCVYFALAGIVATAAVLRAAIDHEERIEFECVGADPVPYSWQVYDRRAPFYSYMEHSPELPPVRSFGPLGFVGGVQ